MKKILYRAIIFSLLFPAFYLTGCMDTPDGFEAPQWDVNLSTPIMDTTYTLEDAIKKSDMIKSYPAGAPNANILYYADNKEIEKVTVGNSLKLDQEVNSNEVKTIGEVKIQDPAPRSASISSSWTNLQPGQSFPIPAASGIQVGVNFQQITEFNYVVLSAGSLDLSLHNAMDVDITLSDCKLVNTDDNSPVGSAPQVLIPARNTVTINVPLNTGAANKIYSRLGFNGTLSTPGSNGSFVSIPQNSIDITASFKSLAVSEVQGKIQVNTININKSFEIDNQTKFQTVVIDNGDMTLKLANNIDVDLNAKIKLLSLYSSPSAQKPYEITLRVPRKSSLSYTLDLSNFVLRSGGDPTNQLTYEVAVTTEATSDYRIVRNSDDVSETVKMSQLSLRSITGIVKPTTIDIKPTTVSLNLGDLKDKLKFAKISFKDPDLKLYLKPSSKFKVKVDGIIKAKGYSSTLKFTDYISNLTGEVDTTVNISSADLAAFLSGFTPNLPTELTISGTATVNPDKDQVIYSVAQSDSITGHAEIAFPFNVGISDGEFTDTTEIKLKDDAKKEADKIQSVVLTLQVTNGLPAGVKWTGSFLDATEKIKLLDLPPNRPSGSNFILVPAATVDANGKVTAPSVRTETIEITGSDVDKFVKSNYIISNIDINTSGATSGSASPVQFKITDAIKVKASVRLVYRVNEK